MRYPDVLCSLLWCSSLMQMVLVCEQRMSCYVLLPESGDTTWNCHVTVDYEKIVTNMEFLILIPSQKETASTYGIKINWGDHDISGPVFFVFFMIWMIHSLVLVILYLSIIILLCLHDLMIHFMEAPHFYSINWKLMENLNVPSEYYPREIFWIY